MTSIPFRSYMICTAPRSGSTLLCGLLVATCTGGNPDSHFHSSSLDNWLDDYGLKQTVYASREECLRAVFKCAVSRGKGDTEIFGLRMQRGSFDHFMQQLRVLFTSIFHVPTGWVRQSRVCVRNRRACGIATRMAQSWSASPLRRKRDTMPLPSGTTCPHSQHWMKLGSAGSNGKG